MLCLPYTGTLRRGHFGIDAPRGAPLRSAPDIFDLMILPRVDADVCGPRLGMDAPASTTAPSP